MEVLLAALFVLEWWQYSLGHLYSDTVGDMCQYRFHLNPLQWHQAQEVCRRMNRTLAILDNTEKLDLLAEMIPKFVPNRVRDGDLEEIWIGLKAEMACLTLHYVWENGEELNKTVKNLLINYEDKEGCIAFKPRTKNFTVNECNDTIPYICEAEAFINLSLYTVLPATVPPELATSFSGSISPSSTTDVSTIMTDSSRLVETTAAGPPGEMTTSPTNEKTTDPQFQETTTEELIKEITTNPCVSYVFDDAIESSETTYTVSALADKPPSTTTHPLTAFSSVDLKKTPVESSSLCRGHVDAIVNRGMSTEMISKKIRQIAEDMEGDGGKMDDTCKRVFSENVAGNGYARDKTFPRGAELLSSINAVRREIIMSKMRRN